ncbi:Rrf2 family transcriptional regulator [Caldimonas tepidiphila]|uniref:Rrf2 family transcriptional regulator n=1 Tax=Caldimonas tepidiphila TaxID=2315841 RepID=UPI000E5B4B62|nr:Rrf2 family transcriptional regulator [Caldimonas tepidiphila]
MKLTAFTDYSLRVLIYLAAQPGRRATIAEVAASFDVKENHLTKVVHALGKAGWLQNVRGKGGGMELARPAAEIVVGEVVRRTEDGDEPTGCFADSKGDCCITHLCRLQGVLREAVQAFYLVLDGYTLADLVHNRDALAEVIFTRRPPGVAAPAPHPKGHGA